MAQWRTGKKLRAAVRFLTVSDSGSLEEDARVLGQADWVAPEQLTSDMFCCGADFLLLVQNRDPLSAFVAMQTQWRLAPGSGLPTGLDYAGCRAVVEAMGLDWAQLFPALLILEDEMLGFFREQQNREPAHGQ